MHNRPKCFFDELAGGEYTTMDAGLRIADVEKIIGTVDKCGELDRRLRPLRRRDRGERYRRSRMFRAFENPAVVPSISPVNLYWYRGAYYVEDGHRGLAAALAEGIEFLDAQVPEIVTLNDCKMQEGVVSRRRFESDTGLKNIRLTYEPGYQILLDEIKCYRAPGDTKEIAVAWQSAVFLPTCRKIDQAGLSELLTGMIPADIFVTILRFHRGFDSGFSSNASFETMLENFIEVRGRFKLRLMRRRVIRFLRSIFSRIFPRQGWSREMPWEKFLGRMKHAALCLRHGACKPRGFFTIARRYGISFLGRSANRW